MLLTGDLQPQSGSSVNYVIHSERFGIFQALGFQQVEKGSLSLGEKMRHLENYYPEFLGGEKKTFATMLSL